jgi:hypothetical protein
MTWAFLFAAFANCEHHFLALTSQPQKRYEEKMAVGVFCRQRQQREAQKE